MAINALKVIKWVGYRMINIKPYIRKVNVMVQRSVVAVSVFVGVGEQKVARLIKQWQYQDSEVRSGEVYALGI